MLLGPLIKIIYRKFFGILRGEILSAIYINNNIDSLGVLIYGILYSEIN